MCFASDFLWYILSSCMCIFLEDRGENTQTQHRVQLNSCYIPFTERSAMTEGTFLSDLQVPINLEASQLLTVFLSNKFLCSLTILINQGKMLRDRDFPLIFQHSLRCPENFIVGRRHFPKIYELLPQGNQLSHLSSIWK